VKTFTADASRLDAVAAQLGRVPLFAALPPAQRREIAERATLVEARTGEAIVRQGDATSDVFVMLSGEAAVQVRLEDHDENVEVGLVLPDDILGEFALLLDEPRTATVTAHQPCTLLRLDAATFRKLASDMPGFGLALSQDLARRFRATLSDKNQLQSQHMPAPVAVRRVEITHTASYLASYYASAIQSVLRRHKLLSEGNFPVWVDTFSFTTAEKARWRQLFGAGVHEQRTPFTYHTTSATMALMQILSELGVNFRHLLHLRSEMNFDADGRVLEPGAKYSCAYQIADMIALGADRAAIICRVEVHDAGNRLVLSSKEYFIIRNLEPDYVALLEKSKRLGRHDARQFRTLARRKPKLVSDSGTAPDVTTHDIIVPEDAGVAYGRISGDMNMVHTTAAAARLFGFRKPFVQGLYTANHVLRALTGVSGQPPLRVSINFSKQIFVGQTVHIHQTPTAFEVCDREHNLLAFGDWISH
jgi:CRP-like cAMP-binding protein/acyl dehydratase